MNNEEISPAECNHHVGFVEGLPTGTQLVRLSDLPGKAAAVTKWVQYCCDCGTQLREGKALREQATTTS